MAAKRKANAPKAKAQRARATVADVRKIALALPDAEERPSYGTPGFFVRKKLFARVKDDETIVVRIDPALRDALVLSSPRVFSVTPHYVNYPWVVVSLSAIGRARLTEALLEGWRYVAPPALRARLEV